MVDRLFHIYDYENNVWIEGYNNIHLLIDFIVAEVSSAGGDGDCTVICKCYHAEDLAKLYVEKHNKLYGNECKLKVYDEDGIKTFVCSSPLQESAIFTEDLNHKFAGWEQCVIKI